jgi:hypothetical protein
MRRGSEGLDGQVWARRRWAAGMPRSDGQFIYPFFGREGPCLCMFCCMSIGKSASLREVVNVLHRSGAHCRSSADTIWPAAQENP